jgi:hypothetical protein
VQVKNVDDLVAETSELRESLESSTVTMEDMRGKYVNTEFERCYLSSCLLRRWMIWTFGWLESFYSFF